MATLVKTSSGTWKAVIRKTGWPTTSKTFRLKRDAEDWARRTEDEIVRGVYIKRSSSERLTIEEALKRYLQKSHRPNDRRPLPVMRDIPNRSSKPWENTPWLP